MNLDFISDSFADHPTSYGTLHPNYRMELQVILPQYDEEVFGCKGTSGVATLHPHWHSDSNFVGARQGGGGGCLGAPPPRGGLAACEEEPRRQETINLLALDDLVELFARAHHSG